MSYIQLHALTARKIHLVSLSNFFQSPFFSTCDQKLALLYSDSWFPLELLVKII